jgi:hypothetical protein
VALKTGGSNKKEKKITFIDFPLCKNYSKKKSDIK